MSQPEVVRDMIPDQRFWIVIFLVVMICLLEACGQTCIKKARVHGLGFWIMIGAVFYCIVALLLYMSYKYDGMGHVNLLWSCLSIILAITIGVILFKEPFNRYTLLAIFCAMVAIWFAHKADELG